MKMAMRNMRQAVYFPTTVQHLNIDKLISHAKYIFFQYNGDFDAVVVISVEPVEHL